MQNVILPQHIAKIYSVTNFYKFWFTDLSSSVHSSSAKCYEHKAVPHYGNLVRLKDTLLVTMKSMKNRNHMYISSTIKSDTEQIQVLN